MGFLSVIELACDPTRTADVAAVIMHEGKCQVGRLYREEAVSYFMFVCVCAGLAHVCVVTPCMTITRARIEMSIPRKRKGSCANHDKVPTILPCTPLALPFLSSLLFSPYFYHYLLSLLPSSSPPFFLLSSPSSPSLLSTTLSTGQHIYSLTIFICRHFKDSTKQSCKLFLDISNLTVSIFLTRTTCLVHS